MVVLTVVLVVAILACTVGLVVFERREAETARLERELAAARYRAHVVAEDGWRERFGGGL